GFGHAGRQDCSGGDCVHQCHRESRQRTRPLLDRVFAHARGEFSRRLAEHRGTAFSGRLRGSRDSSNPGYPAGERLIFPAANQYGCLRGPSNQEIILSSRPKDKRMKITYRPWLVSGLLFAGISLAPIRAHVAADDKPLYGYSAESSRIERQWEEKLRAIPSPENLRAYMQRLSARPHHVGSPYDKDNAEWIAAKFKEF